MRTREGCCADWPKPCPYHEGWADATDAYEKRYEAIKEDRDACNEEMEQLRALLRRWVEATEKEFGEVEMENDGDPFALCYQEAKAL